ncbi:MAG: cadmium-translocating P-type ATPase, partial [Thiotrichales bacterium]|nr:cadmium-translocating P-type ATPase [Thiotrichales bacterium]
TGRSLKLPLTQQLSDSAEAPVQLPSAAECFHCRELIPADVHLSACIDGVEQAMCCPGCKAVAEAICGLGLEDYYRHRTSKPARPELIPDIVSRSELYDHSSIQDHFVSRADDQVREADFIVEGLVCPACAWLIETRIQRVPGVREINVNYSNQRCRLAWDPARVRLSEVLVDVAELGYKLQPYNVTRQQEVLSAERHALLRRIGVAGVLGIQVMMIAIALYHADWSGMESRFREFFNYLSLLLCIPILTYSAQPFFKNAWRDIRIMRPGMDVPVSLGLLLAFFGSLTTTVIGAGHVYYESVAMFVFFLLLARYFEFSVRNKINHQVDVYTRILPVIANRISDTGTVQTCAVAELNVDDVIRILPGESVPVDCRIRNGETEIDEAIVSGESLPLLKVAGSDLIAGSINITTPINCVVTRVSEESFIARIQGLLDKTVMEKTGHQEFTNRIASWFVTGVICLAILVAWYWYQQGVEQWLAITVSVLIITCPCALALAAPVASTAMVGFLMRHGILAGRKAVLQLLPDITHIVFDKTGTLTSGALKIHRVEPRQPSSADDSLEIAAALEKNSEHPIARAFTEMVPEPDLLPVSEVRNFPGHGLTGRVGDKQYYLGSAGFVRNETGLDASLSGVDARTTLIVLADKQQVICYFHLNDNARPEAGSVVKEVKNLNIIPVVMSGDRNEVVKTVSEKLGIKNFYGQLGPEDKLSALREYQQSGHKVLMIGDGINDGPVMAAADISIAMGRGTDLVKNTADIIFLDNSLENILTLIRISNRTSRIIRQNICWAIGYNLLAIPAAVTGLVAPWLAALGMSLSSLAVVINSYRVIK